MTSIAGALQHGQEIAGCSGSCLLAESVSDPLHFYSTSQAEQFTMSEHSQFEFCASTLSLAKLSRANATSSMKLFLFSAPLLVGRTSFAFQLCFYFAYGPYLFITYITM